LVPFPAGLQAKDLCPTDGRDLDHPSLLLHGGAPPVIGAGPTQPGVAANLDAASDTDAHPKLATDADCLAHLHTSRDRDAAAWSKRHLHLHTHPVANPDADTHQHGHANEQSYANIHLYSHRHTDGDPSCHAYVHRNSDGHANGDSHKHTDQNADSDVDPLAQLDADGDRNIDQHANGVLDADRHNNHHPGVLGRTQVAKQELAHRNSRRHQEDCVKKRRAKLQLNDEQQLILGFVLVILLAISMLYCLGFASIAVRQTWVDAPLPEVDTNALDEGTLLPSTVIVEPTGTGATLP
jgi:hypothetical protein